MTQTAGHTSAAVTSGSDEDLPKPTVIGVYGVSGCGKTTLVNELKDILGTNSFVFFDGSTALDVVLPGDLAAFKVLDVDQQTYWRTRAADNVKTICQKEGKVGIVAGHYMFWDEGNTEPETVWTQGDRESYTHILYLEKPAQDISQQCAADTRRSRQLCSFEHLNKWQLREKDELRRACLEHGLLFSVLPMLTRESLVQHTIKLVRDFQHNTEEVNLERAKAKLVTLFEDRQNELQTMLVFDGDKTLVSEDSGKLFWEAFATDPFGDGKDPLTTIFSSGKQYVYRMFRQVMLLYEEVGDSTTFDALCSDVASRLTVRPEFKGLLHAAATKQHVGVVVLTVGLSRIFSKVLERESLVSSTCVIGSERVDGGFVVTGEVKASLIRHMRRSFGSYIYVFGDSPLDIGMLVEADQAIVVVGDETTRSKSMDSMLHKRMAQGWPPHSKLQHLLLPNTASRHHTIESPLFELTPPFTEILSQPVPRPVTSKIIHATDKSSAKLLMTPQRDASVQGPALRQAHDAVGRYLTAAFVTEVVGIESYSIPHVQGGTTEGYRLLCERQTLIIAMMRGGEPMALGVNAALPSAMFLHAKHAADVKEGHLLGTHTVLLVDSVINNGDSMLEFITHIRSIHAKIHIVMVAGVVQRKATVSGALTDVLLADANINLIALRMSDNKYTGKGGTDTGNRLFNTTRL